MNLFGLTIQRSKATAVTAETKSASLMDSSRGWWPIIREPFTGAWQHNVSLHAAAMNPIVAACEDRIASDVAKLRLKLVEKINNDVWKETESPAFSPVLRKPNTYQTRVQFWECWILSKLRRGNTYVLKERDGRGVVVRLHILNPDRVCPQEALDGSVFYELRSNRLAGLPQDYSVMVPAREIIHDRMYAGPENPLVGISPLQHAAPAAALGNKIQDNSLKFFGNNSQPSGILTADQGARLTRSDAEEMKEEWQKNYGGDNFGRVAVLGGGLRFVQLAMSAADAQLIEQHRWSAEIICSAYHMPPYKVNIGTAPLNNNVQALDVQYHSQCLQRYFESIEILMDEGLGIGDGAMVEGRVLGTEFDLANLLRMDSETQAKVLGELAQRGLIKLNEGRAVIGYAPMDGGDTAYMQEQMWPVVTLGQRPVTELKPAQPAEPMLALPPPDTTPAEKAIDAETETLAKAGRAHLAAKHLGELLEAA